MLYRVPIGLIKLMLEKAIFVPGKMNAWSRGERNKMLSAIEKRGRYNY